MLLKKRWFIDVKPVITHCGLYGQPGADKMDGAAVGLMATARATSLCQSRAEEMSFEEKELEQLEMLPNT